MVIFIVCLSCEIARVLAVTKNKASERPCTPYLAGFINLQCECAYEGRNTMR